MITAPLDFIPLSVLFLLFGLFLWLGIEGGYRLACWRRARISDEKEQPVGAMVASILGLVALVLGFTFSLAAARFDARRMGVLDEANAIGTAYLRTQFLPEPQRTESVRLLQDYVAARLQAARGEQWTQAIARSEALQTSLWQQANEAAEKQPTSI